MKTIFLYEMIKYKRNVFSNIHYYLKFLLFLSLACTSTQNQSSFDKMNNQLVSHLEKSVFEVVIPKYEDPFIKYSKPLPFDKLPFKERNDKFRSVGTAFAISENRYVSAAHVFDLHLYSKWRDFSIRDSKGNVYKIKKFYKYSQYRDLVVFDISPKRKSSYFLEMEDSSSVGETIYSVGNAQGEGISIRGGQIASYTPEEVSGKWNFIRISAPTSPGNSGGPLVNEKGKVVGIITRKNENENLNYAVPVSELKNLKEIAEFSIPELTWSRYKHSLSVHWTYTQTLPTTLKALSKSAQNSLYKTQKQLISEFNKKYSLSLFPNDKQLSNSTRDLLPPSFMSLLTKNSNDQWILNEPTYKSYSAGDKKNIYHTQLTPILHSLIIEKPETVPLLQFMENPGLQLETIFKSVGKNRVVAGQEIPIVSYGAPLKTDKWNDYFGRKWYSSNWKTQSTDLRLSIDCTVIPKGAACVLIESPNLFETFNLDKEYQLSLDQIALSYSGTLTEWKEFLSLPKEELSPLYQNSKIELKGKSIVLNIDGISVNYNSESFDSTSHIYAGVGFDPYNLNKQKVRSLVIRPNQGRKNLDLLTAIYSPIPESSEEFRKEWMDIVGGHSPFDGKVFIDDNDYKIHFPIQPLKRWPTSSVQNEYVFIVTCTRPTSENKDEVIKSCQKFKNGIKLIEKP